MLKEYFILYSKYSPINFTCVKTTYFWCSYFVFLMKSIVKTKNIQFTLILFECLSLNASLKICSIIGNNSTSFSIKTGLRHCTVLHIQQLRPLDTLIHFFQRRYILYGAVMSLHYQPIFLQHCNHFSWKILILRKFVLLFITNVH